MEGQENRVSGRKYSSTRKQEITAKLFVPKIPHKTTHVAKERLQILT